MSASELNDLLFFEDADTLAFIDPPSYRPAWSLQPSSDQSIGHRVHSQSLLRTGSPILKQLFDQKTQERNIKRRGELPDGIKYLIDFTPPSTGEEAVLFLTELSCPSGIRTWAKSRARWELPGKCVSGTDTPGGGRSDLLPEYCPARHRAGIVHILQELEGMNPELDTPCKLWTFFALAKMYEIATLPHISTLITDWVYESNNTRFIELHPEITYRMAKGIQCEYLLRDSFCILVGEEALLLLRNLGAPGPNKQRTSVHGRPRDYLDDDDVQRVQYAGESLLARINEEFVALAGSEMAWLKGSIMYQNLLHFEPQYQSELETVTELICTLKDFVRTTIVRELTQHNTTRLAHKYQIEASSLYPTYDFLNVYGSMPVAERIATRTFWQLLSENKLSQSHGETGLKRFENTSIASLGGYMGPFRDQQDAIIRYVTVQEMHNKIGIFNSILNSLEWGFDGEPPFNPPLNGGRNRDLGSRYFSLKIFIGEIRSFIKATSRKMLATLRGEMKCDLTDTLVCLMDKETRYLPLWAGGCDDETGGVYVDQIPLAETDGFSAPGPSIHTGSTASSYEPSISVLESTVHGASHRATESHESEVVSLNSEFMSDADNVSARGPATESAEFLRVDDEISLALDSSADDVDDMNFDADSDSDDTVVGDDHGAISDFEDLSLDDDRN
ncbi:hypothetical protein BJX99DRAFT_238139 [Aspergillus californicus]